MSIMTMTRPQLVRWLALCVGAAVVFEGCRGHQSAIEDPSDPAVMAYGYAPQPDSAVRLQPGVVVVEGGAQAIREASPDGLTWTIDGSAPRARDLRLGSVLFLTSRAVGRVVRLQSVGNDLSVVLAPVSITDVIRDADIRIEQDLSEAAFVQETPTFASPVSIASWVDGAGRVTPALWRSLSQSEAPKRRDLPTTTSSKAGLKIKVAGFDVEPYVQQDHDATSHVLKGIGLKISRALHEHKSPGQADFSNRSEVVKQVSDALKVSADMGLYGRKIKIRAALPIRDGKVGEGTSFVMEGIEEMSFGFLAGAENGLADNTKLKVEVPLELFWQYPPTPSTPPLVVQIKFKFVLEVLFSAKNSTLGGSAKYALSGPLGYEGGAFASPTFQVTQSIFESMSGISLGPAGLVYGIEIRGLVGVGTKAFSTGIYTKVQAVVGVSKGSILGAPLAMCKGASLKVDVGLGVAVLAVTGLGDWLGKILGKEVQTDAEILSSTKTVKDTQDIRPKIPLCGAQG